jgi:alcohol dehydrogenase YqhD (iron-dependent ADH family)
VVLQNGVDILKGELGSSTETCATSTVHVNEVTGVEAERVSVITEEEDQEPRTIPVIKMEPRVSVVPVVSVWTFLIGYMQNCLPV